MSAVLAIDTAADRLQLALRRGDGSTDTVAMLMRQGHAEALFPAIDDLLGRNGLRYSDLGRIAALSGPGSFTGLRVGLAAARGLALALSVPALGVPTLLALRLAVADPVAVLLDARRGEAYFQLFGAGGFGPVLMPMDAARAAVPPSVALLERPVVDIARLAAFAASADPAAFPPDPLYIRAADAKPQEGARVARLTSGRGK